MTKGDRCILNRISSGDAALPVLCADWPSSALDSVLPLSHRILPHLHRKLRQHFSSASAALLYTSFELNS